MNIFVLDERPELAASYACDKHVVKQILETAQLLSTAHHMLDGEDIRLKLKPLIYKSTHKNHPCSIWARENVANYSWLAIYGELLCFEYTRRYQKTHKTEKLMKMLSMYVPKNITTKPIKRTPFPQCMPDEYKNDDVVEAYRAYYIGEKRSFARWKNGNIPEWYKRRLVVHNKQSEYDVYIGRPSKWGNPFSIGKDGNREEVIVKYQNWLMDHPDLIEEARKELKGKILGCWCRPADCHGDILVDLVNT